MKVDNLKIIQISAKQTWNIRHTVMWPNKSINYVKLPNDKDGIHYGLTINGAIVSIVSVFIINKQAQFRKFATLNNEQGKGYGSKLLNQVFVELKKLKVEKIWCNARIEKSNFYKKFGMNETDKMFEKGGISYVIMQTELINKHI